jgi:hypothetical protein
MKHIKTFEKYQNKKRRDEIIKESVLQVNDIYKVRTMIDIPQSLINSYVKKVKDTTGKNLRQFFGDVDIAEEIVKYINVNFLNVDTIPAGFLTGDGQAQTQGEGQVQTPQSQPQAQGQAPQAQPQAQGQAPQGQAQPQAQGEGQVQVQTEGQPQAQGENFEEVGSEEEGSEELPSEEEEGSEEEGSEEGEL